MAPDLPKGAVRRVAEFERLKNPLVDDKRRNPSAIATALEGSGGYGRTTLTSMLCHDPDIRESFEDLWVTVGESPNAEASRQARRFTQRPEEQNRP
jgi:hypothetical protein